MGGGFHIGFNLVLLLRYHQLVKQRMFRCHYHVSGTKERVWAGGVDGQFFFTSFNLKLNLGPFGSTYPCLLLALGGIGPVQAIQSLQKFFRISGDTKHNLAKVSAFDRVIPNFGFAINHFLIGKYCPQVWAPPDWFFVDIGKTSLEELEENPLSPLVVARIGGVNLSLPVDCKPNTFNLTAKIIYIALGGEGRMRSCLDCILLSGQPKSIPTHWVKHIISTGLFISGQNVRSDITFGMANMQAGSGWIGEHIQGIVLGLV